MFYEKERSPVNSYIHKQIDENLNFSRHMHRSFEFIDVLDGEMIISLDNGREYKITASEAALVFPYQVHSYRTPEYSKSFIMIFSLDYVRTFYDMIKNKSSDTPIFSFTDKNFSKKLNATSVGDILMLKSYLYAVCAEYSKQVQFVEHSKSNINLLDKILEYVELHYTENITLKRIADEFNYNYHYLSNFFNSQIGINFKRFLNEFRIHQACVRLREDNYSITEIAHMSGYDTLRSFNREFLSITGVTPSEYKGNSDLI